MDSNVVVKKEPADADANNGEEENCSGSSIQSNNNSTSEATTLPVSNPGPVRYVSRRGRPPGGGYSMKTNPNFINFNSSPLVTSAEYGHPSSSSLSPQDLLKSSAGDSFDIRRFGFPNFDADKNSFRCDGCDIVFSSRDTYAMHMLLRAKNESCVALPTSAISSNPENPTPREKFERELRQQAMLSALRNQATAISKAAAAASILPKTSALSESLSALTRPTTSTKERTVGTSPDVSPSFGSLFSLDTYGMYLDPRHYRRLLAEYGLRASSSTGSLAAMMEQLSCSVCGELFSNKDALAMHMMFHTRGDEGDCKDAVAWKAAAAAAATSIPHPDTERRRTASGSPNNSQDSTAASRSEVGKRRDGSQSGDRQLTAERVAELKRMAIESSLRASASKAGKFSASASSKTSPRPKSVSEDMSVTSTAQSRPLSADDAIKFANASYSDPRKSLFANSSGGKSKSLSIENRHLFGTDYRKRYASSSISDHVFDSWQWSLQPSSRKQARYDRDFYADLSRSYQAVALDPQNGDKNAKVCDNHVSSASGPQDSDETSDGFSSSAENASAADRDKEETAKVPKTRGSPYLDAIMSNEAVLVPLEPDEAMNESDLTRNLISVDDHSRDASVPALDFSFASRKSITNSSHSHVQNPFSYSARDRPQSELSHQNGTDVYSNEESFDSYSASRRRSFSHPNGAMESLASSNSDLVHRSSNGSKYFPSSTPPSSLSSSSLAAVSGYPTTTTITTTTTTPGSTPPGGTARSVLDGDVIDERGHGSGTPRDVTRASPSRTNEARYCPHCEILFLDVTLFHLHMGLHNVNNPWQCNTCGIVCAGRLEFNTHVLHY
ncbi:uncharacterized protein LOC101853444 [Aplysia californica]|uniref:Uncharacterized protein LOC101853444 n=1 Tax=Aplysia californica TaxID=6500 RepID=A0ABM0JF91_APLCA|nr:uncharacterized protein LOC101853444 [Aplysia californica]